MSKTAEQKVMSSLERLDADIVYLPSSCVVSVYFTRSQVTDADLKCLKELSNLAKLKLNQSPITDAGLKGLGSLVQLHLADTKITDVGLQHLATLTKLGFLDLSNTQVTNDGLKCLTSFKECKTIRLSGTKVTDSGVTTLKRALPECKITL
jgi:internalin A